MTSIRIDRRHRRATERHYRRALVASGCTCWPTLRAITDDQLGDGFIVRHDRGCPFGDLMVANNLLGVVPTILVRSAGPTSCHRPGAGDATT
ncbi:hypothetical protein BH24ACT5_BH24ACT5_13130 [soil metagenome]